MNPEIAIAKIQQLTNEKFRGHRIISLAEMREIHHGYTHRHLEWHNDLSISIWGVFSMSPKAVCIYVQDRSGRIKYYDPVKERLHEFPINQK